MNISFDLNCFFDGSLGYDLKTRKEYKKNLEKCIAAGEKLNSEVGKKTNSIINSFEQSYQNKIKLEKDKIKNKKNKLIIGLGGSSAGAKAINQYLGYNFYFFDNYDPAYIYNFLHLHDLNEFNIYVISKSGNTFETLAIFNLVYQHLIKKNKIQEINDNICCITENSDNALFNFAKKNSIKILSHNPDIGGRFSVFSETAMSLFDINPNIVAECTGKIINKLKDNNLEDTLNPVVNAAILLSIQEINNLNFNINLLYEYSLKNFSYWFHQLFAESLGKNENALTPMTSICPKDHHSMMQLYIDGPRDKFFNIYEPSSESHFDKFAKFELGKIENKSPSNLLKSQFLGLVQTFREKKIPFKIISINHSKSSRLESILQLLSYNILETIILGYAQNIDPYDQPAVEQIKLNTFKV